LPAAITLEIAPEPSPLLALLREPGDTLEPEDSLEPESSREGAAS